METTHEFHPADRYFYDFGLCSVKNGYAQLDTRNDAPYFGMWANPMKRIIFSYIEGDCNTTKCETDTEFVEEITRIAELYGTEFLGIDPGFDKTLKARFVSLGLKNLLH